MYYILFSLAEWSVLVHTGCGGAQTSYVRTKVCYYLHTIIRLYYMSVMSSLCHRWIYPIYPMYPMYPMMHGKIARNHPKSQSHIFHVAFFFPAPPVFRLHHRTSIHHGKRTFGMECQKRMPNARKQCGPRSKCMKTRVCKATRTADTIGTIAHIIYIIYIYIHLGGLGATILDLSRSVGIGKFTGSHQTQRDFLRWRRIVCSAGI